MRPRHSLGWPWRQGKDDGEYELRYGETGDGFLVVASVRAHNHPDTGEEGWKYYIGGSGGGWCAEVDDAIEAAEQGCLERLDGDIDRLHERIERLRGVRHVLTGEAPVHA